MAQQKRKGGDKHYGHLQCPPLGRPPPMMYLHGMSAILIMHPMTVMMSRHKLFAQMQQQSQNYGWVSKQAKERHKRKKIMLTLHKFHWDSPTFDTLYKSSI